MITSELYLAYIYHSKNCVFTQNVYAYNEEIAKEKIIKYFKETKPEMKIVKIDIKETII